MNLSGPYQRLEARYEGQKGGALLSVAFRSRPVFAKAMQLKLAAVPNHDTEAVREATGPGDFLAWRASVWDEVHATTNGVLSRRIRILITDGAQPGPGEAA